MKEALLSVKNLSTSFFTNNGEVQAVRDVSFDLHKGEILGIVGESGSGKSVTNFSIIRLLADNARIKSGSVIYKGNDLTKISMKKIRKIRGREISMIFQDSMTSLNPLMTVGKQVQEMLTIHFPEMKGKAGKKKVLELFEMVRIPEGKKRFDAYPHEFSGGMRQRALIAMSLACNPEILIADEPTTALDVTIQDQILKLIKKLQDENGMSVIFITHDLAVVAETCSRVIVMYGGMIMEQADINELFYRPLHPYTKGLMASLPDAGQLKSKELKQIPGSPPDMLNPPAGCPFSPRCDEAMAICRAGLPPLYEVSDSHYSRCWLLDPKAPLENNPFAGYKG